MGGKTFKVGGRFGYQNTNAQYADMCTTKRREIPRTTFLQALDGEVCLTTALSVCGASKEEFEKLD